MADRYSLLVCFQLHDEHALQPSFTRDSLKTARVRRAAIGRAPSARMQATMASMRVQAWAPLAAK